jgi:hypothetical protein
VAALLEAENPAPGITGQVAAQAEREAGKYYSAGSGEMIKGRMPNLVKGAGFIGEGANTPLTNHTDIMTRAAQASLDLRMATYQGFTNKSAVVSSLNQGWLNERGALKTALTMPSIMDQLSGLVALIPGGGEALKEYAAKSFTAGNLGIGSVYGNVPFNLLAPSRLIYPVYTVN